MEFNGKFVMYFWTLWLIRWHHTSAVESVSDDSSLLIDGLEKLPPHPTPQTLIWQPVV